MKHTLFYTLPLMVLPFLLSCSGRTKAETNREEAEREGQELLQQARKALAKKNYIEARQTVMRLRKETPLALDARRQAILVLDSVELAAANDSVGFVQEEDMERMSLKQKFYERKLQEDLKSYGMK